MSPLACGEDSTSYVMRIKTNVLTVFAEGDTCHHLELNWHPRRERLKDFSRPFDLDQAHRASMRQDAMPLETARRLALVLSFAWLVVLALSGAYLILPG